MAFIFNNGLSKTTQAAIFKPDALNMAHNPLSSKRAVVGILKKIIKMASSSVITEVFRVSFVLS